MNKIYFSLLASFLFSAAIYAQQKPEMPNPLKDKRTINGYTVRLIPSFGGGSGYDIMQNNKTIVHQFRSPIPSLPGGIRKKEDAFKVAEWVISDHQAHGHWRNTVPPDIARKLNIQTH